MTRRANDDDRFMAQALALATRGEGSVEPNPMVGCVIVRDGEIVGEGFHERFRRAACGGERAAERRAIAAAGATVYVTLEPCCHHGKTPPCTQALIRAGVERVVVAVRRSVSAGRAAAASPNLQAAGIQCDVGVLAAEAQLAARAVSASCIDTGRPWVIAKWAMTLDGKLATRTGDSHWISSEASRAVVHQLRGRVDAVIVGSGTARADDPLLTARPANLADVKRIATRIVVDSAASLSLDSRLVQTAGDVPVLVAVGDDAPARCRATARGRRRRGVSLRRHDARTNAIAVAARRTRPAADDERARRRRQPIAGHAVRHARGRRSSRLHRAEDRRRRRGASPVGGAGIERMADALEAGRHHDRRARRRRVRARARRY